MSIQNLDYVINAVNPIRVHFSQYSNGAFLLITQVNKLGNFILAEIENPESQNEEKVYNIEVKFGDRCDEWSIALARAIIEKLGIPKLMIICSLVTQDIETFNLILKNLAYLLKFRVYYFFCYF
jgi:hypothetical protein